MSPRPAPSIEDSAKRHPGVVLLMVYIVVLAFLAVSSLLVAWIFVDVSKHSRKSVVMPATVVLGGAAGGVLFAMHGSTLRQPHVLPKHRIRLGWVADAAYGIAGAFVVFLVMPGMSETMPEMSVFDNRSAANSDVGPRVAPATMADDNRAHPAAAAGDANAPATMEDARMVELLRAVVRAEHDHGDREVDFVELMAVALVGGYTGRALMKRAAASLAGLSERVDKQSQEIKRRGEIIDMLERQQRETDNDANAIALTYMHVDVDQPPQAEEELQRRISSASRSARARIWVAVRQAFADSEGSPAVALRVIPLLQALIATDPQQEFPRSRELLARAMAAQGDWPMARDLIYEAIRIRDAAKIEGLRRFETFAARCEIELCPDFQRGERSSPEVVKTVAERLGGADVSDLKVENAGDARLQEWLRINGASEGPT